ncbi:hypothetical protein PLANPX_5442 [Lacipirellula parvula]|uniref:Uncharacterized protein n=1 Tax=Lacipirellula parvula TaxID=2650471 RepID=A0A5K7XG75_9BACT|nr:hypothetical protein PLANPX_5442 [Lacipirellula parvula]
MNATGCKDEATYFSDIVLIEILSRLFFSTFLLAIRRIGSHLRVP